MTKTEGASRTGRRQGTKSKIRLMCQRQTRRALRRGRKATHYVGAAAHSPVTLSGGSTRTPVAGSPSQSLWLVTNSSRRVLEVVADSEEGAKQIALDSGHGRKLTSLKAVRSGAW